MRGLMLALVFACTGCIPAGQARAHHGQPSPEVVCMALGCPELQPQPPWEV